MFCKKILVLGPFLFLVSWFFQMLHVRGYCILTNLLSIGCRSLRIIFEDWVDPTSILGIIYVIYAQIGEATKTGRSYRELLNNETFYLEAICALQAPSQLFV